MSRDFNLLLGLVLVFLLYVQYTDSNLTPKAPINRFSNNVLLVAPIEFDISPSRHLDDPEIVTSVL